MNMFTDETKKRNFLPKRRFWGMILAILLCFKGTLAVKAETGSIHGTLTDKRGDKPLAGHPITLRIHKTDGVESQETTTDESGNYRFDNLSMDATVHYTVVANYEGTEYTEKDLVLSSWAPNLSLNIDIGAVTDDRTKVRIKVHSLVIGPPPQGHADDGAVSVMEALEIENTSDLSFQTAHDNQSVGLHIGLPNQPEDFQGHTAHELSLNSTTKQVMLGELLPPGMTKFGYSYVLHVDESGLDLSRHFHFDTELVYIFIPEGLNLSPNAKLFSLQRREAVHNVIYNIYKTEPGDGFVAGKRGDLKLKMGPVGASSNQGTNLAQMVLIVVATALSSGFFVTAIFKIREAKRTTDETKTPVLKSNAGWLRKLSDVDLEHIRIARLECISFLDEMHEKQQVSERVYRRLHREQTEHLAEILEQCQDRGFDN